MEATLESGSALSLHVVHSADGHQIDRRQPLSFARTTLGRGEDQVLSFVQDGFLSSEHAEIILLDPGSWLLRDRDSRNGTFVNGIPISQRQLQSGDVVRIGNTILICHESRSEEIPDSSSALLGAAPSMVRVRQQIAQVASNELKVLILGETGTGKELVAREIHSKSARKGSFVPINCGAIPHTLVESAFFGHSRGAFSGATSDQEGAFSAADGGTLFLDEVGELPLAIQATLLRVLEDGYIQPIGASKTRKVDVRVVAATNRDLRQSVENGTFRADLYARLNQWPIELPPLRKRREDILLLFRAFLRIDILVQADVVEALTIYDWPRNVRELGNLAERIKAVPPTSGSLSWDQIPAEIKAIFDLRRQGQSGGALLEDSSLESSEKTVSSDPPLPVGREEIEAALKLYQGNVTHCAEYLKMGRKTLYRKLESLNNDPARFRS